MKVLILGGDLRYLELVNSLKERYDVFLVGYTNIFIDGVTKLSVDEVNISLFDIIVFPVNGVRDNNVINARFDKVIKLPDDFLVGCKEKAIIFSGISTSNLEFMLSLANKKCYYLMNDICVVKENVIPTVEGIIADVVNNTEVTICNSKVLIFGYGNIGKVLVKYLNMLGANISVFVINMDDKLELDSLGINCFCKSRSDLIREISNSDVIINTAPTTVIFDDDIKYINKDAYVLDIASHPHGIDQEVLAEYFIKGKLYLGIPGKIAPKTSGKILSKKIIEIMGEDL